MIFFLSCIVFILLLMIAGVLIFPKVGPKAIEGFTYWLMFVVIVGLIPAIFNSLAAFATGNDIVMSVIFGKGELLIISLPIGMDAVGRLLVSGNKHRLMKIIAGFCSFTLTLFSFAIHAIIVRMNYDSTHTAIISIVMFFMIIILSGICVYLSEVE